METIELRVNEIGQLFQSLDPFPFREKDLDKEVDEYIVSWARELSQDQPIKIIIQIPEREARTKAASELAEAFARYFSYRADLLQRELNELYRLGRRFFVIGITILVACLGLSQLAGSGTESSDSGLGRELASARDLPLRLVATRTSPRSIPSSVSSACRDQSIFRIRVCSSA